MESKTEKIEKAQHTPGPWVWQDARTMRHLHAPETSRIGLCVSMPKAGHKGYRQTPEDEANARLIAAAPDLLDACKAVTAELGDAEWGTDKHGADLLYEIITKHHGKLRAAIAKAEEKQCQS